MARIPERKFDPSRPVFARKFFIANGRKFTPGAELDWRKLGVAQRRVQQMFEAGKLGHEGVALEPKVDVEQPELFSGEVVDELDAIDDMKELRRIADEIGAPYKVSKKDQREAIRDYRRKETD